MRQELGGGGTMTRRLPCPPAPGPLEDYAARFDDLFETLAQRRGVRAYLQGLLLPRERNKTLTALAGAEPIVGAQHADVQRLQFFLSESPGRSRRSMPAVWSCSSPIRPPDPTTAASSLSMRPAIGR